MQRNGCKTKKITYLLLVTLVMLLTACSGETDTSETKDEVTNEQNTKNVQKGIFSDLNVNTFSISSEDLQNGVWNTIITNTTNGSNVSPQLTWDAVPDAACYVIYMTDTSAGNWIHWKSNNVTETTLPQGWAPAIEYIGPYPPGGTHTYEIYVIAIKEPIERAQGVHNSDNPRFKECILELDKTADGNSGNILAYGHLSGTYTKEE